MNPEEFQNIAKAEEHFWWYRGQRNILVELLDRRLAARPVQDVLEAGCGTGHMARFLAARYGWRVTALDLSRIGLEHAKRQELFHLLQGDITELPVRVLFSSYVKLASPSNGLAQVSRLDGLGISGKRGPAHRSMA